MAPITQRILKPAPGIPNTEIALFVAQMDDQSRRLTEDTRGATVDELAWQPALGMNTAGMLLAHIAIVEVFWMSKAAEIPFDSQGVLGIGEDDDGLPAPEGSSPPATLAGWDLARFDEVLAKARANTYTIAKTWTDADLDRVVEWTRRDGSLWHFSVRWILYHILEHEAGHYGQVGLLRHLYRMAAVAGAAPGMATLAPRP
jgi:uncharacterized damage-inducible protein DinB